MWGLGDLCGVLTGVHGCQGFQAKHLPGTLGIPTGPWDLQALQGSRILMGSGGTTVDHCWGLEGPCGIWGSPVGPHGGPW